MKKAKRIVAVILGCMMLIGGAITVSAATYYFVPSNHRCIDSACQGTLYSPNGGGIYYCLGCHSTYIGDIND